MKTLEQQRAEKAWKEINDVSNDELFDKYCSQVKSLPTKILQCGLGQAVAYFYSKSKKKEKKDDKESGQKNDSNKVQYNKEKYFLTEYGLLIGHLAEVLLKGQIEAISSKKSTDAEICEKVDLNIKKLISCIIENDSIQYRRLTNEALAYLVWLKRFAEGMSDGKEQTQ